MEDSTFCSVSTHLPILFPIIRDLSMLNFSKPKSWNWTQNITLLKSKSLTPILGSQRLMLSTCLFIAQGDISSFLVRSSSLSNYNPIMPGAVSKIFTAPSLVQVCVKTLCMVLSLIGFCKLILPTYPMLFSIRGFEVMFRTFQVLFLSLG